MKASGYIVAAVLPIVIFIACNNTYLKDSRLYNGETDTTERSLTPEPTLELTGGQDPFDDTTAWYNKSDCNGDEDHSDKADFPHSDFDSLSISAEFDTSNVPFYTFKNGYNWKQNNEAQREYVYAGAPDTKGGGWTISTVTYYLYKGINPNYDTAGNYNTALQFTLLEHPRLNRFYFYRFTGRGGGIQLLDNYLIAVDTYSKFVFAFSKPVEFNSMGAPTKWAATDAEKYNGIMYQFYMYDPIGYVQKNGTDYTVVLYQWFKNKLAKGNYNSQIDPAYTASAKKTPEGAGKSPFNNKTVDFFESNMKLLSANNRVFCRREKLSDGTNGVVLYKYSISSDGKTITRNAQTWNGLATDTPLDAKTYNIGSGIDAVSGTLNSSGGTVFLSDEMRKLTINSGTEEEVAVSNFTDPGPDWLLRVRGKTYEGSGYTYIFSEDGKTISSSGKTYSFTQQDDGCRAVYREGVLKYWGLRLADNDSTLYWSPSSWASPGTTPTSDVKSSEARLKKELKDSLSDTLKGCVFAMREKDSDGSWGLKLKRCIFKEDGKHADISTAAYGAAAAEVRTYPVIDGTDKFSGTINGQPVKLKTDSLPWTLTIGTDTYTMNFTDPGPAWLYRVKGKTYKSGALSYTFSEDGKTLIYKNIDAKWWKFETSSKTYTWGGKNTDTDETSYSGYGYRLSESDVKLESKSGAIWGWEAYWVNQ